MPTTAGTQATYRPRNLVVLSDGTGNSSAKLFRTNVWRIYEALDLLCDDQVALYDNGVGTASFKPLAALGGAFGYGLKRNVLDLYTFLCRNYKVASNYDEDPNDPARHDKIFAFGFSRGAFTARVLASLVANQGLICAAKDDRDLIRLSRWAYRHYRAQRFKTWFGVTLLRKLRDSLFRAKDALLRQKPYKPSKNRPVNVDFLGVFDTVAAYGLPFDELTNGWDQYVWPMLPRDRSLNPRVKCARHAVALDDERQTFFPLLWDEDSKQEKDKARMHGYPPDRIQQVWFAGMHSNVGGGYADDALSMGPLCWMAGEAAAQGLRFQAHMRPSNGPVPDQWMERAASCAPMGDSRRGVAAYYRYHPRPVAQLCNDPLVRIELPKIHESVFERIRDARDSYAPFGLPEKYVVVTKTGQVLQGDSDSTPPATSPNPYEHSTQARSRVHEQQNAWNGVWVRRVVYFATIAATLLLLVLPFISWFRTALPEANNYAPLGIVIDAAAALVPSFAEGWLEKYRAITFWLLVNVLLIGALLYWGSFLKDTIGIRMRNVWKSHSLTAQPMDMAAEPSDPIYKLRTSDAYVRWFHFQSKQLLPFVFGILMFLIIVLVIPIRLVHEVRSRADWICDTAPAARTADGWFALYPSDMCTPTGITIEQGARYAVEIAIPDPEKACGVTEQDRDAQLTRVGPWFDKNIPVQSTAGVTSTLPMKLFAPFRRVWAAAYFVPVATIGSGLPERHYLTESATTFRATRTGPLSIFINDAAFPCLGWDCFYRNNHGGPAKVMVTKLDNGQTAYVPRLTPYSCEEQRATVNGSTR